MFEDGEGDPQGSPRWWPGGGERIGSRFLTNTFANIGAALVFYLANIMILSLGDSVEKLVSHSMEVLGVAQADIEGIKMLSGAPSFFLELI